jgi:hypothetical protein
MYLCARKLAPVVIVFLHAPPIVLKRREQQIIVEQGKACWKICHKIYYQTLYHNHINHCRLFFFP